MPSGRNSAFAASLHYPLSKRTRLYGAFLQGKLKNAAGTAQQKDSSVGAGPARAHCPMPSTDATTDAA